MSRKIRGNADNYLNQVLAILAKYEATHPQAEIEVYRQNSASIRVRIIDPDFAGISRSERHDRIWNILDELPEETQSHISLLLPLTPGETAASFANMEFEQPIPSRL